MAGADASIYSMIRPQAQGQGPLEQYGALMQLKAMGDASQLHGLQRQKLETDIGEEAAFKSAIADWVSAGGKGELPTAAMAASPTRFGALQKQGLERRELQGKIDKADLEVGAAKAKDARDSLATVRDQQSFDAWRQYALSKGYRIAEQAPMAFDAEWQRSQLLNADKHLEETKPVYAYKDVGGKLQLVQENPRAGKVGPVAGTDLTKTLSPGEVQSGVIQRAGQAETNRHNLEVERRERDIPLAAALEEARVGARERTKNAVDAQAALPGLITKAEDGIRLIDQMIGTKGLTLQKGQKPVAPHPGFQTFVGATLMPGLRFVEGTDTAGFGALYNQIKGKGFLEAFESLKGGGQITQVEGDKATQALLRMDKAQNEAEFVTAAREFQDNVRRGMENARRKAATPTRASPMAAGGSSVMAPKPAGGIRFLGFEGQ
jgi:hypothetical protein